MSKDTVFAHIIFISPCGKKSTHQPTIHPASLPQGMLFDPPVPTGSTRKLINDDQ